MFRGLRARATSCSASTARSSPPRDTDSNNVIGSAGAETYVATIGSAGFTVNTGATGRDSDDDTADWIFHDPGSTNDVGERPVLAAAGERGRRSRSRSGSRSATTTRSTALFVYYTTDGADLAGGRGRRGARDDTQVVELFFDHRRCGERHDRLVDRRDPGAARRHGAALQDRRRSSSRTAPKRSRALERRLPERRLHVGQQEEHDGRVGDRRIRRHRRVAYCPHNDFGADCDRAGRGLPRAAGPGVPGARPNRASIYNTFVQPFYYDAATPTGRSSCTRPRTTRIDAERVRRGRAHGPHRDRRLVPHRRQRPRQRRRRDGSQTATAGTAPTRWAQVVDAWRQASPVTPDPAIASAYPGRVALQLPQHPARRLERRHLTCACWSSRPPRTWRSPTWTATSRR